MGYVEEMRMYERGWRVATRRGMERLLLWGSVARE